MRRKAVDLITEINNKEVAIESSFFLVKRISQRENFKEKKVWKISCANFENITKMQKQKFTLNEKLQKNEIQKSVYDRSMWEYITTEKFQRHKSLNVEYRKKKIFKNGADSLTGIRF